MLVNSFDTKYSLTAKKYESLDSSFTKIVSANKKFSRIYTSVIKYKSLDQFELISKKLRK